jgi:voltage-dependent calcium channel L type alpha-1D
MILSIIGNSICLALTDYSDEDNLTIWNQRLGLADNIFTIYYIAEAVFKILAFGFIVHKRSYLRDPWNVIDFIVVVIGIISLVPNFPNLKALRIFRVLRPLRSINAVPTMKRLVSTLLLSLPQMGYLVSFLLFFITVFAILGMQIFARDLYSRCRLTNEPIVVNNGTSWEWPIDPTQERPCGGFYECSTGTYCHSLLEKNLPLSLDKVQEWDQI